MVLLSTTPSELQEQVGKHRPGDRANVTYIRNGKEVTVPITMKNVAGNTNVVTPGMGGASGSFMVHGLNRWDHQIRKNLTSIMV